MNLPISSVDRVSTPHFDCTIYYIYSNTMQLVSPAGNFATLRAAVENGADAVYLGFNNQTNARCFEGLNFTPQQLPKAIALGKEHGVKLLITINTYPRDPELSRWLSAIDEAVDLGVDGLILADPALLRYASKHHPSTPRHLSVQGSVVSALGLELYLEEYGIQRAVLPRVLDFKEIEALCSQTSVEIEVFGFGSLCVMCEGRCILSSWICGESPNSHGACSPSRFVSWQSFPDQTLEFRLNQILIDRYQPHEVASYPTLCKGRYQVEGNIHHAFEKPRSLNLIAHLPRLMAAGVKAIKIEGRQRSPAYVAQVTQIWRKAIDASLADPARYAPHPESLKALTALSEGGNTTCGAYLKELY